MERLEPERSLPARHVSRRPLFSLEYSGALPLTGPEGDVSAQLKGPISADDMSFLYSACIAGAGLALLPVELARGAVLAGSLARVLPGYYVGGGAVYIMMPSGALVPSRVALLRDHLTDHIKRVMEDTQKDCAGVKKRGG